jgi:hypothetical protein
VTALHALAHTYEMVGDREGGRTIFEQFKSRWEDSNLFANHLAWHKGEWTLLPRDAINVC